MARSAIGPFPYLAFRRGELQIHHLQLLYPIAFESRASGKIAVQRVMSGIIAESLS
ncbi:protein of unknown function [Serratia sp. Tan611]|nr:protein of unknown function [Serratia sp. Tan611]